MHENSNFHELSLTSSYFGKKEGMENLRPTQKSSRLFSHAKMRSFMPTVKKYGYVQETLLVKVFIFG